MSKDLLSHYGPDAKPGGNRAECGGVEEAKPIRYSPPLGPKNMNMPGPGLRGGTNYGSCGTQGKRR